MLGIVEFYKVFDLNDRTIHAAPLEYNQLALYRQPRTQRVRSLHLRTDTQHQTVPPAQYHQSIIDVAGNGRKLHQNHTQLQTDQPNRTETRVDIYNCHQSAADCESAHQGYCRSHPQTKLLLCELN